MKVSLFPRIALFLIVLLHVTLLDFFYATPSGLVFLPEENARPITIFTHLLIAAITLLVYVSVEKLGQHYRAGKLSVREPVLIVSSVAMIVVIGYLLVI